MCQERCGSARNRHSLASSWRSCSNLFCKQKNIPFGMFLVWRRRRDFPSGHGCNLDSVFGSLCSLANRRVTAHPYCSLSLPPAALATVTLLPVPGARVQIFFANKKTYRLVCFLFGGEGPTIPKSKFYFTIPVTIEMVLYRSMQIEDLLFENKIFW